jgi:glycosyltransferase involved in cell wall biosynthesis
MEQISERELIAVQKSENIRFLTLVSSLTRGGTERAAMNYAIAYHRAGFPSAVLAINAGGPREAVLEKEGIPVFIGGSTPNEIEEACGKAKAWNPDILHLNRPGLADPTSALALRTLIHPRLRVFETNVFAYVDRSPDRFMIDLHLQLSRWCLWKWMQSASDVKPKSPSVVVPYSVDSNSFHPPSPEERALARQRFGIPERAFVFGRVGQPSMGKWSPELIYVFRQVAEKNADAWLAVCGAPTQLQQLIADLPESIRSRVVELPIVDNDMDLQRYYHLMDAFVHISNKGESFGMVLCEAMLSGLPVITKSTPLRDNSQVEVVQNNKTGFVVANPEQLVSAMQAIQSDDLKLQSMRENAPKWVRESFDLAVVNRHLLKLASMALESASRRELAEKLAADPDGISCVPGSAYRSLLESAGIRQGLLDSVMTGMINTPLSRGAIDFVRSVQRLRPRKPAHT